MTLCLPLLLLFPAVLYSQTAAADDAVAPDTVVATVNGRAMTVKQVDQVLAGAPPRLRENLRKEPKMFLENYALVTLLSGMAEKEGLHEKSPFKEQLEWFRNQTLMQIAINEHSNRIKARIEQEPGAEKSVQDQLRQWLDGIRDDVKLSFEHEEFFSSSPSPASSVSAETVIATINDKPLTVREIELRLSGATPQIRQNFIDNRKQFVTEYALMLHLADIARNEKLEEKSPYKEQLEWVRSNQLMQAKVSDYTDHIDVKPDDEQAYYDGHLDEYTQAQVKVLYTSFTANPPAQAGPGEKKALNEEEAKAKIESLRKQIDEGADFVELVKEHSEDQTSVAKDGDFGTIHRSDSIPAHIMDVIFSLKAGEVSQPVRQPNGFYLFRVEQIGTRPLAEVRNKLNRDAKSAKFQEWFDSVRESSEVTFENEAYFATPQAE